MYKNIIKGGKLNIVSVENNINLHRFYDGPDDAYVPYKMAEVETEKKNIDINVQKFNLYKFSELTEYKSEDKFGLPNDRIIDNIDNINNLYLFGLYKDTRNEYFIKKMPRYNKQIFEKIAKSLNSVFKSHSSENCSIELIVVSHNDEETGLKSLFIIFVVSSNNKKKDAYKTLKESISKIPTLIDYNEIKKRSTLSYLNNFIIYTNDNLKITTVDAEKQIKDLQRELTKLEIDVDAIFKTNDEDIEAFGEALGDESISEDEFKELLKSLIEESNGGNIKKNVKLIRGGTVPDAAKNIENIAKSIKVLEKFNERSTNNQKVINILEILKKMRVTMIIQAKAKEEDAAGAQAEKATGEAVEEATEEGLPEQLRKGLVSKDGDAIADIENNDDNKKKTLFLLSLLFSNKTTATEDAVNGSAEEDTVAKPAENPKRIWIGGVPYHDDKINGYYILEDNRASYTYSNGSYKLFLHYLIDQTSTWKLRKLISQGKYVEIAYTHIPEWQYDLKSNPANLGRQPWNIVGSNGHNRESRSIEVLNGDTYDFINNLNHDNMMTESKNFSDFLNE